MSKEKVIELLKELGSSSAEIAAKLYSLSIRGNANMGCSCPIANFLRSNGIDINNPGVGAAAGRNGYFHFNTEKLDLITYPFLAGVIDFILDFDAGFHSHLQHPRSL
jgi:hypothetical protein